MKSGTLTINYKGRKTPPDVFEGVTTANYKSVMAQVRDKAAFVEVVHAKGTREIEDARRISSVDYTGPKR